MSNTFGYNTKNRPLFKEEAKMNKNDLRFFRIVSILISVELVVLTATTIIFAVQKLA